MIRRLPRAYSCCAACPTRGRANMKRPARPPPRPARHVPSVFVTRPCRVELGGVLAEVPDVPAARPGCTTRSSAPRAARRARAGPGRRRTGRRRSARPSGSPSSRRARSFRPSGRGRRTSSPARSGYHGLSTRAENEEAGGRAGVPGRAPDGSAAAAIAATARAAAQTGAGHLIPPKRYPQPPLAWNRPVTSIVEATMTIEPKESHLSNLLLIPLEDSVVFPNMTVTLTVDVGDAERVLLVPVHDGSYATVGTVAEVADRVRLPGGATAVTVAGLHRGIAGAAQTGPDGRLRVEVDERPDEDPPRIATAELEREYRAVVEEILEVRDAIRASARSCARSRSAGALADTAAYSPDLGFTEKVQLLEAVDVVERLELALACSASGSPSCRSAGASATTSSPAPRSSSASTSCAARWSRSARSSARTTAPCSTSTARRSTRPACPTTVREQAEREVGRLERMGDADRRVVDDPDLPRLAARRAVGRRRSEERLDPVHAREVLDADHAGLEDVKERIVEYLAVRKLRQERGIAEDKRSGAILTLIGPPGTGKTSIGESIARALNREFVRMSLGGVRDEAEIRGHRRTYIGALPGRLVRALRDAGTMNPVILLDEVDKVGADWRGDPSAALLEVLDPAQNHSFRDHYLDVELDLSRGRLHRDGERRRDDPRPAARPHGGDPLRRLHGRREGRDRPRLPLAAPARAERPARGRGRDRGRRCSRRSSPSTPARPASASSSASSASCCGRPRRGSRRATLEAPVEVDLDARPRRARPPALLPGGGRADRGARRRDRARGHRHGRRRALRRGDARWTATSGSSLTGQLGDVMKESAQIALSYVRAHADELGIDEELRRPSFHVHVPAGAIPKDGPSAGITMTTALASLLTGRPVKHTVGMTGEVTLQGRVLPIGGLKQKVLAAHAAGSHGRDHPGAQPRRPRRRPGGRARGDDVPSGDERRRGARARTRAGAATVRCRRCNPVPEEVRRAAGLLERRWTLSILYASIEGARALQRVPRRARAACRPRRWRRG